jgi:ribosomal protein S18 acetylase RimI-like enzyme
MEKQIERVRIRRAEPSDAAAIARVHVESWQAAYLGLLPATYLNRLNVPDQTEKWSRILRGYTTPGSRTWVLSVGGKVMGFSASGPSRDNDLGIAEARRVGEIYTIYLSPRIWGHGLGAELIEAVELDLTARGYRSATLWVLSGNTRARRFYELVGWKSDGTQRPIWMGGASPTEMRYRRAL